jgi:nitrate/nitrite-specific signal transduction histidine kinase
VDLFQDAGGTFRRIRKMLEERVEVKTRQLSEKNKELEKLSLVASRADNGRGDHRQFRHY